MLRKTGLLIVSNPTQIGKILSDVPKKVKNTLYIQLLSSLAEPFGQFYPVTFNKWPKYSKTIFNIYSQAAVHCNNLDVQVLLSGLKYNSTKIRTQKPIDLIIFDRFQKKSDIETFIANRIENITKEHDILVLDHEESEYNPETVDNVNNGDFICKHTVLGGTFDRLHIAHKLLLSEAALRASEKITVGVTEGNMIHSKLLWELIENIDVRIKNVKDFLSNICSEIKCDIVPIFDPFGPAITDPTMELIIVSEETIRGGQKINKIREEKKLQPLKIVSIELVDEPYPSPIEEPKISSSTLRIRLLGTVLRPVEPNNNIPKRPYIIGLTGGIASGKSGVALHLESLGVDVIYADIIGHEVYKLGKPCHKKMVDYFGDRVLDSNGEINRKVLGGIVFKDPAELKKLNSIVWPFIAEEVQNRIKSLNKPVVVLEAAILLTAGWQHMCHEVWTTLVPRNEAINRIVQRNQLTVDEACYRIDSQPPNTFYVEHAHVVFSPYWDPMYTREQVIRAWNLLQKRM